MSRTELATLRVEHVFSASAELVFDAWIDPKTAGKWLFATDTGTMVRVDIDARPGGEFNLTDRRDGLDIEHVGRYLEIDRPRRLVFTFAVPYYSKLETTVTIDIESLDSGCKLTLTQADVLPEWSEPSKRGWGMILSKLELHLA